MRVQLAKWHGRVRGTGDSRVQEGTAAAIDDGILEGSSMRNLFSFTLTDHGHSPDFFHFQDPHGSYLKDDGFSES